jgi:hypothetical protein
MADGGRFVRADRSRGASLYFPVVSGRRVARSEKAMDFLEGVVRAGLMIVFLIVVIGLLAALFMIVFGIATGIDDKMQS